VHRRRSVTTRVLAAAAIVAAAALLLPGCSPGADYPSIFPAIHDMPPPRAATPLDADQVQQATEALISERNHLSAEAQGSGQAKTPPASPTAAKKPAAQTPGAAAAAQTAGAETKP
jgi:hypothetical protein